MSGSMSRAIGTLTTALAVASCSDVADPVFETIDITVSPAAVTIPCGGTGTATATLSRGGYGGVVDLIVSGLPPGVTASLSPSQLSGPELSAAITLAVAVGSPVGRYGLAVVASADGVPAATGRIELNVVNPGLLSLRADPADFSVVRGGTGQTELSILGDHEYSAWPQYALVDPPDGVTATFTYHFDGGYPATATLSVPTAVPAGQYTLTFMASFGAVASGTIEVGLTVLDP
jgi:hypothetical protein